jgi:hypothetical protein
LRIIFFPIRKYISITLVLVIYHQISPQNQGTGNYKHYSEILFNDIDTIENTEFIEISNKVQFTIKDVTIPIIDPTMLEKIRLNVEEKYLIVFIQFLIKN